MLGNVQSSNMVLTGNSSEILPIFNATPMMFIPNFTAIPMLLLLVRISDMCKSCTGWILEVTGHFGHC